MPRARAQTHTAGCIGKPILQFPLEIGGERMIGNPLRVRNGSDIVD